MKKILITGGAGFVGGNLSLALRRTGYEVVAFDNLVRRGSELNLPLFKQADVRFIHGDVRNPEDFNQLIDFIPDIILECSAQPSATEGYGNVMFDITNNYMGLVNVLEYARRVDGKVIFWSTNKVYCGDKLNDIPRYEGATRWEWFSDSPTSSFVTYGIPETFSIDGGDHSIYGMSKVCADLTCQEYARGLNVPVVINRFSCLAGERQWGLCQQGWVAWFSIAAELGLPIHLFGWKGKQVRDVLFIQDIVDLIHVEIEKMDSIGGEVFNVGGGPNNTVSLIEAIRLVEDLGKKEIEYAYFDETRKADQCIYISDIRKVKTMLGWEPRISIEEGYQKIINWVHDSRKELKKLYL